MGTGDRGADIIRVKSIDICSFRGIRRLARPLNTDADVVLLTGPNGFGKTSLIDALSLVLTGYIHPRRDPVLFQLPSGPQENQSPAVGTIKAVLLTAQGEKEVKISLSKNKPPVCSDMIWQRSEAAREIAAKASFFYQDIVEQSFDSFTEGTTLKDFLAPPPQEIVDARTALKEALKMIKQKDEALALPGVESEAVLNEKREHAADSFSDLWEQLVMVVHDLKIPVTLPRIAILKKDSGLRQDWENKLTGFTLELAEVLLEESSAEADAVSLVSSLINLQNLVDELKIKYLIPRSDIREQIGYLFASLPAPQRISDLGKLDQLKEKCLFLEENLAKSKTRLEQLTELENHFKNPEGPGLWEIMNTLRRYGPKWSKTDHNHVFGSDLCPPEEAVKWAADAYASLHTEDGRYLDDLFALWLQKVESKGSKLVMEATLQEKVLAEYKETLKILEEMQKIADGSAEGRKFIEDVQKRAEQPTCRGNQDMKSPNTDSVNGADPLKLIDRMKNVLKEWINIEERDIHRKNVLEKSERFKQAKERILLLKDALNRESRKGTSILENALQLPDNEPHKLADLINSILPRFRLVQGILPVHIKTSYKRTGKTRQGTWEFVTADGRTFTSLSTGQQSQLALAMLLGLNISLDISYLGHGIIALDDTTTSFDMSQLPREAALLRQIAYGAGDGNSDRSVRQLFIVSHHENLTHKLIDFLIPPEGKKMHILDFVDWNPQDGPEIEQYEMEPAKPAQKGRKDLAAFLNKLL